MLLSCCRKCSDNCGYETNHLATKRTCHRRYFLFGLPISGTVNLSNSAWYGSHFSGIFGSDAPLCSRISSPDWRPLPTSDRKNLADLLKLTVPTRGLLRPDENAAGTNRVAQLVHAQRHRELPPKAKPLHGEKLCKRLTAHRTAAVQIELAQQPTVALAVLMYRMILVVFDDVYGQSYIDHAVRIDVRTSRDALVSNADDMGESTAWKALEEQRAKWARMLPRRTDELLAWLLQQDSDIMSNLFAFCVAATVDGISPVDRAHAINEVANTMDVDLTRYWKPTRAGYFEHVSKDRIMSVVGEAVAPQAAGELRGMKKADAAAAAELRMTDSGWLPEVLSNRGVPKHVTYGHWEGDDEDNVDDMQGEINGGDAKEAEAA